jgi:hypothetical protein
MGPKRAPPEWYTDNVTTWNLLTDQQRYKISNRDKIRAYRKLYRSKNHKKLIERDHEWRMNNKDRVIEYRKEYRAINSESMNAIHAEYMKNNPEKCIQYRNTAARKFYTWFGEGPF